MQNEGGTVSLGKPVLPRDLYNKHFKHHIEIICLSAANFVFKLE